MLQVFDVVLNGDLTIATDLDVFERVGRGVAHDEYIEFEVSDGKILYEGDESEITGGKMRVEFIKSYRDNPKVNAIILFKGRLSGKNPKIFLLDLIWILDLDLDFQIGHSCRHSPMKSTMKPSWMRSKILLAKVGTQADPELVILMKMTNLRRCCQFSSP